MKISDATITVSLFGNRMRPKSKSILVYGDYWVAAVSEAYQVKILTAPGLYCKDCCTSLRVVDEVASVVLRRRSGLRYSYSYQELSRIAEHLLSERASAHNASSPFYLRWASAVRHCLSFA